LTRRGTAWEAGRWQDCEHGSLNLHVTSAHHTKQRPWNHSGHEGRGVIEDSRLPFESSFCQNGKAFSCLAQAVVQGQVTEKGENHQHAASITCESWHSWLMPDSHEIVRFTLGQQTSLSSQEIHCWLTLLEQLSPFALIPSYPPFPSCAVTLSASQEINVTLFAAALARQHRRQGAIGPWNV
jgi:hypothetical protein